MVQLALCFGLLMSSLNVFASAGDANNCSAWTKQPNVSCIFASQGADSFERQCENPCFEGGRNGTNNLGPYCNRESLCFIRDPKTFSGLCSEWFKDGGASCFNPTTGAYEQQWVRACTVGLKEVWCSNSQPN